MLAQPISAVVAVTLRCNARCVMCDLWQTTDMESMQPADFSRLPASLRDVNISGGEPFLRPDVHEIVHAVRSRLPKARIVISTNGFLPARIERQVAQMPPGVAVRVSLDGIGEAHETVRRIPAGFDKVVETLERLDRIGVKDLGVGITASRYNADQIEHVRAFARQRDLHFNVQIAHDSPLYFGEHEAIGPDLESIRKPIMDVVRDNLSSFDPREMMKAYYHLGLLEFATTGVRTLTCRAGNHFFYLDAYGNVYACNIRADLKMGNLLEQRWEAIFADRREIWQEAQSCNGCWMLCTVGPIVHKRPLRYVPWLVKQKLKAMAGGYAADPAKATAGH